MRETLQCKMAHRFTPLRLTLAVHIRRAGRLTASRGPPNYPRSPQRSGAIITMKENNQTSRILRVYSPAPSTVVTPLRSTIPDLIHLAGITHRPPTGIWFTSHYNIHGFFH